MADLTLAGEIAGTAGQTVRLTVIVQSDYRDERGMLPPPVYLFESLNGGAWRALGGGPATVIGSISPGIAPAASCTYVTRAPGLPPFARTVQRRIYQNTNAAGVWDFTIPDSASPVWNGSQTPPPSVNIIPGQGEKGDRGASVLSGTANPPSETGMNGDVYLNFYTFDLFQKAGGVWTLAGNLKGGTGAPGPEGPRGLKGDGFLKPTAEQVGFIAVADNSQPYGFSWYSKNALGLTQKLGELADVQLDDVQPGTVYGLEFDASINKFKNVLIPDSPGGGGVAVPSGGVPGQLLGKAAGGELAWFDDQLGTGGGAGTGFLSDGMPRMEYPRAQKRFFEYVKIIEILKDPLGSGRLPRGVYSYFILPFANMTAGSIDGLGFENSDGENIYYVDPSVLVFEPYGTATKIKFPAAYLPGNFTFRIGLTAVTFCQTYYEQGGSDAQMRLYNENYSAIYAALPFEIGGPQKTVFDGPSGNYMLPLSPDAWPNSPEFYAYKTPGFTTLVIPANGAPPYFQVLGDNFSGFHTIGGQMPNVTSVSDVPNGGHALLTSTMPPRQVYRHTDGTLYYGAAFTATP